MKINQLALSTAFGLVRIEEIVTPLCIYCTILTGDSRGGLTVEYATTITPIPNTEKLKVTW